MADVDAIVASEAERAALERLRQATGVVAGPMERHSLRCRHIAHRLAGGRGWVIDGEILTVAALLHDIGLYPSASRGGVYTADGAAVAGELLEGAGWEQPRIDICRMAIDRHHDLRPQYQAGGRRGAFGKRGHGTAEVEALRLADLVDVSGGWLRFGLERAWLRRLFAEIPRAGLYREVGGELWRALRERPVTLPRIFLRPPAEG